MDEEEYRRKLELQLEEGGVCPICGQITNVIRAVTEELRGKIVVKNPRGSEFKEKEE